MRRVLIGVVLLTSLAACAGDSAPSATPATATTVALQPDDLR
jgi:hypothetical protein